MTLVLLPGMDGSGKLFDAFADTVGVTTQVVRYPPDRPLDYDQLEPIVEAALPVNEPFVLLAESFSGPLAITIAAKNPPGLKALVLVCTFARLRPKYGPTFHHALLSHIPFWRVPVSLGSGVLLGRFNSSSFQSRLGAAMEGVLPVVWRTRLRSVLDVDVTEELRRVLVPVLYLRATEDRVVPAAAADLMAKTSTRVKLVDIEGPHALLQTQPRACVAAIRTFAHEVGIDL